MTPTKTFLSAAGLAVLVMLSGCSAPAPTTSGGADSSAPAGGAGADDGGSDASADNGGSGAAGDRDVCALVPTPDLATAIGADPGDGVNAEENGLSNCTWTVSDTHTVLAQYTDQPDLYLPRDIYPMPDGAAALSDVDYGWASAEQLTVIALDTDRGILVVDINYGDQPGGQDAWTALGNAIAANL